MRGGMTGRTVEVKRVCQIALASKYHLHLIRKCDLYPSVYSTYTFLQHTMIVQLFMVTDDIRIF